MDELVDYCINLGQSYAAGQIELGEARGYIAQAINEYADIVTKLEVKKAISPIEDGPYA